MIFAMRKCRVKEFRRGPLWTRLLFVAGVALLSGESPADLADYDGCAAAQRADGLFALDGASNIVQPQDCGLINGYITLNGWLTDVARIKGLFAPPYHSSDFVFDATFNGSRVAATGNVWRPEVLTRTGTSGSWQITSRLYPVANERAAILEVVAVNGGTQAADLAVAFSFSGGVSRQSQWSFSKPGAPAAATRSEADGILCLDGANGTGQAAFAVQAAGETGAGSGTSGRTFRAVPAGGEAKFHVCLALDQAGTAKARIVSMLKNPAAACQASVTLWRRRVAHLFSHLPALETASAPLERLYDRSLLHLLLNEWRSPDFVLHPFYSTGGLNGGCTCNYLWNFGEVYRLWAMTDSRATREHVRAFLKLDLSNCYALEPCTGGPLGPYYMINQEKITFITHAYVLETGDVGFLGELLNGRTILGHLIQQALMHDDLSQDAVLVDYGSSNSHLELRTSYKYNGVMADLNLRRIVVFRLVDELCKLAGVDAGVDLAARADALRARVKRELYNSEIGWYNFVDATGTRDVRWTIQMFKALGWGDWVMGNEERTALVGHLMSTNKFLGAYGLHSLSKLDPAYDESDVDNAGPGACVSFTPAVVDRLYRDGYTQEAETIFRRLYWLADALPCWGDSQYADRKDYRRDTPLQNDIEGASHAQTVIFSMLGLQVNTNFTVTVNPHPPADALPLALRNVKLAGRTFDLACGTDGSFTVTSGDETWTGRVGTPLVLPKVEGVPSSDFFVHRKEKKR